MSRSRLKTAVAQGIGRHTEAEVYEMGIKDLRAISVYLGAKTFFTGDKVTELDCTMFGILSYHMLWNPNGSPLEELLHGDLANFAFCERMKDWDHCLNPPRAS